MREGRFWIDGLVDERGRLSRIDGSSSVVILAMTTIQTSFPIQDAVYQQAVVLANELQISQNELFALAVESYLCRHYNRKLQQSINDAYADGLDPGEKAMLEGMRRHQQHLKSCEP